MARPKVYVTRRVPEQGIDLLREECEVGVWQGELPVPREVLREKVAEINGLYCLLTEHVDAELLDAAPRLRVVSNMAAGYDNIDVEACTARGIPVGNTPGVLTDTTADCAFGLLMAAARRIVEGVDYVRAGQWRTWEPMLLLGQDVHGATLGIVGFGRIGQAMARRARGFGMRVLYHDNDVTDPDPGLGAHRAGLETLLGASDFVTLHVPLTDETYHLIDRGTLAQCKRTAILVNTSRGEVIDTDALFEALQAERIAGAALDVTEPEPLPADHRLLALPNCIVVPHIASASVATRAMMAVMAAENPLAGLRGNRLPHGVNPEVHG